MISRDQWHAFLDLPVVEWTIFVVGMLLMIVSPLAGVLPGPGGILVFALGLAMVLKTSMWAKRHYVRFKRWQPRAGRVTDWGLRRGSPRRREALRKERERRELPPPHCIERTDDPLPHAGFDAAPVDPTPGELKSAAPVGQPNR
ncbi:hypothetical protein ACFQPG_06235 [Sphingomonas sp. GCM10030256]|uniref:hypothetical protein n=1 Tax=Sphingomonas sp. GCM10030256 TaxID=3273427 RepID=UPI003618C097